MMSFSRKTANELIRRLSALRDEMRQMAEQVLTEQLPLETSYQPSAHNLLHYLTLRQHDLRPLQKQLATLGLSSLGRAESHALASVETVLQRLHELAASSFSPSKAGPNTPDFATGQRLLAEHTAALLGPEPDERTCRIMVTMPSEAADDYGLIHALLQQGMDCMRINCAHDDSSAWARMIDHLRVAEQALGRSCRVLMDLAGPKLRTGPLTPEPGVIKVKPQRDDLGRVTIPARIWLTNKPASLPASADCHLTLPATWLKHLRVGDKLTFTDARDAHRSMIVTDVTTEGCWAELSKTAYFVSGTRLLRKKKQEAAIGKLPPAEASIRLKAGDSLILTRNTRPGHPARIDHRGEVLSPAVIGCTLPKALQEVQVGNQIWFDDGQIGGVVQQVDRSQLLIQITQAKPGGSKLRADKGINLPDSEVHLSAPTDDDIRDLAFVAKQADIVALSFVNQPRDVSELYKQIRQVGPRQPAVVLKIETQRGFTNLANLLLSLMQWPVGGIMLARGDLAVECGFERLAEVQEEIMWLCEAAHIPVIWATQVLEGLAKTGLPSRAEITDAAMGHRAECVMLNKGPHIVRTVEVLDGILRRMQGHQDKKNDLLRELQVAHAIHLPQ